VSGSEILRGCIGKREREREREKETPPGNEQISTTQQAN